MSSPTRFQYWSEYLLQRRLGYTEAPEPDPNPEDPTDYAAAAEAGAVQVLVSVTETAELLEGETITSGSTGNTGAGGPLTPGNTANGNDRNHNTATARSSGVFTDSPTYWWAVDFGSGVEVTRMRVWDPIGADEWLLPGSSSPATTIIEWSDDGAAWTSTAWTYTSATVPSGLSPPLATEALEHRYAIDTPSTHRYWRIRKTIAAGVFVAGDGMSEWFIDGSTTTGEGWQPAPSANDGDDATYDLTDAIGANDEWLRVALEVARLIYRAELRVGTENAGSTTYELYGSDDALFTSPVLLDSVTFAATGSFTAQEVSFSWLPAATYQYYELRGGPDDDRRVYDLNLYSAVNAGFGVTDHGALDGLGDDDHPQYALTTEGGRDDLQTHGALGSTENIDPTSGNVHTGTLDADCTITLLPPATARSGAASILEVWLTEDGTGGWTPTFAASGGTIVWPGGAAPDHDTTADTLTRYVFETLDDGMTWYGLQVGSGGSALTVEDEGTPLATAATTLDFVGAGVTASGAGATKTITIPGGGGDLDDLGDVTITTPAEHDTLRYDGAGWVNENTRWEPVTFNFGSGPELVWDGDDLVMEWKAY